MSERVKKFNVVFSAKSDIGLVRTENQDSFGIFPEENSASDYPAGQLFIVADGMGGHQGGKDASSLAVKTVKEEFFSSTLEEGVALKEAIEKANHAIFSKTGKKYEFSRMGTTCSALVIKNEKVVIGHVGDSRIYRIENNHLVQLTNDHTKVQEMLREGILTPEEARNYPSKSVLARALGIDETVKVDVTDDLKLKRGQIYILCSDGLSRVSNKEILSIVQHSTPSDACDQLIEIANERGGKDNITVVVIKIDPQQTEKIAPVMTGRGKEKKPGIKSFRKRSSVWLILIAVFFVIIALLVIKYKDSLFPLSETKIVEQPTINRADNLSTDNKSTKDPDYSDKKLLEKAQESLRNYDYDNAYLIYKSLLSNPTVRQEAIDGMNQIASSYLTIGDNYVSDKKFSEALKYYRKAEEIQPDNKNIKSLIKLCTDQLKNQELVSDPAPADDTPPAVTKTSPRFTVSGFDIKGWIYPGMDKSECSIAANEINFTNALSERFIVFNKDLFDVTISAEVHTDNSISAAGLIIGYVSPLDYYVFKYLDGGNYILQRVKGNEIKNLLEVKPKGTDRPDFRKMKIIYSDNLISIYDQKGLISSYKSVFGIFGKSGVYVDKGSTASLKDISISGVTNLD